MTDDPLTFDELMRRVGEGHEDAAAELVKRYEPHIRRVVRVRLTSQSLRQQFDSMDVCQSVMADLLGRASNGKLDFETPAQLLSYLTKMAKNRLIYQARKHRAKRRDVGRLRPLDAGALDVPDDDVAASRIVSQRDLWEQVSQHLTVEENWIARQRAEGRTWSDIAAELSDNVDAVRIRFTRAVAVIAERLRMDR